MFETGDVRLRRKLDWIDAGLTELHEILAGRDTILDRGPRGGLGNGDHPQ
jgi:hypothetical protein